MAFCDHCQGQRFDRSRVLRKLRELRKECRATRSGAKVDAVLAQAIDAVRALDIPHFELEDAPEDIVVH